MPCALWAWKLRFLVLSAPSDVSDSSGQASTVPSDPKGASCCLAPVVPDPCLAPGSGGYKRKPIPYLPSRPPMKALGPNPIKNQGIDFWDCKQGPREVGGLSATLERPAPCFATGYAQEILGKYVSPETQRHSLASLVGKDQGSQVPRIHTLTVPGDGLWARTAKQK